MPPILPNDILIIRLMFAAIGLLSGVLASILGVIIKNYFDVKAERDRERREFLVVYLDPLRSATKEFHDKIVQVVRKIDEEINIPDVKLELGVHLRYWFKRCKEVVVDESSEWTDDARYRELSIHSGGSAYDGISSLYITSVYLYHATLLRRDRPIITYSVQAEELYSLLETVRQKLASLGFYDITQESTGMMLQNTSGKLMTLRGFVEEMTKSASRGWFLTLTDVFYKFGNKERSRLWDEDKRKIDELKIALNNLILFCETQRPYSSTDRQRWSFFSRMKTLFNRPHRNMAVCERQQNP